MARIASVPLEAASDGYIATIGMNGHPARMIVDSGSERSIISGASLKRLNIGGGTFNTETLSGIAGYKGASVVQVQDVRFGEAHGRRLTMLSVPEWSGRDGVDGVLGIDYLEPFDLDLDIADNQLGLYRAISGCREPRSAMTGALYGAELLEFSDADTHVPQAPVVLNGERFIGMLDTGSFHTSMYRSEVERAGLSNAKSIGTVSVLDIGGHKVAADVLIAPALEIGDLTVRDIPIVVLPRSRQSHADILLGRDFFERVHVWISHSSKTVILQFPPAPKARPPA